MSSGYEGVREIQKRLTNTMGWSATSGQVGSGRAPWAGRRSCAHKPSTQTTAPPQVNSTPPGPSSC